MPSDRAIFTVKQGQRIAAATRWHETHGRTKIGTRRDYQRRTAAGAATDIVQALKITGTLTIGGGYLARVWGAPTGDVNRTGSTFTASDLGVDPGADNATFYNLVEMGKTTHDLSNTNNTATLVIGLQVRTDSDGKRVFVGPAVWPGC